MAEEYLSTDPNAGAEPAEQATYLSTDPGVGAPRGGDHRDLVTQSLLDHGVKPVAAAAILGDIQQESSFNPHSVSDHGTSFGLLQVGGPMFRQFNQDQAAQGIRPGDPQYVYNQAPFIINKFAQQHPDRWAAMQNAPDAPTALQIFRSTKDWGYGIAGRRYQYAQNYQQALKGVPVEQVDQEVRVEKAIPIKVVEHQVSQAQPVLDGEQHPPAQSTPSSEWRQGTNAQGQPYWFTNEGQYSDTPPAAGAGAGGYYLSTDPNAGAGAGDYLSTDPNAGLTEQDILAPAGEARVSQISSDLLQDPNAPPPQTAPTPTGELPPQPVQQDWTTGRGVVKPLGLFQDPNESQNFLGPEGRKALETAGGYVQTGVGKGVEASLAYNPLLGTPGLAVRLLPEESRVRQTVEGVIHGAGELAKGQATLENAAIITALGVGGVAPAVAKGVSNVFAAQMATQLPEIWQAFKDAPDYKSKVSIATEGMGQVLLTLAAAKHGVFGEEPIPGAVGPAREAVVPPAAAEAGPKIDLSGRPAQGPVPADLSEIKVPSAEAAPAPGVPTETARVAPGAAVSPEDRAYEMFKQGVSANEIEKATGVKQDVLVNRASAEQKAGTYTPPPLAKADVLRAKNLSDELVNRLTPEQLQNILNEPGRIRSFQDNPGDLPLDYFHDPVTGETGPRDPHSGESITPPPAAAQPEVPAAPTEPPGSAWAGVPFMSQDRVKTSLAQMGYTPEQIEGMTKSELAAIDWQGAAAPPAEAPEAPAAKPPAPTGPAPGVAPIPAPQALGEPALPRDLTGAKPRYNYNLNSFTLRFESDLDKAAYITAQATRSKADARYLKFVADSTGLKEKEIRALGQQIRDRIKPMAKAASAQRAETGAARSLTVPRTVADFVARKAATEMVDARRTQVEAAGGVDLLKAIIEEGGFPARGTKGYNLLKGELGALADMARGAKLHGQSGMMMGKLFSKTSRGTDALLLRLRARGFDVEHPAALIDRTIQRLRTGVPDMALPEQAKALGGFAPRLSRDEPGFELAKPESVEQQKTRMAAEKANAELRAIAADKAARIKYGWSQKLTGTAGDLGQGSLIGQPEDLFAPAAKPRAEGEPPTPIPQKPAPAPEQQDFKFARGAGSVAPGSNRRYTLPDETRQRFQPVQTNAPGFSGLRWHIGSSTGIPVDEVYLPGVSEVARRLPRTSGERSVAQAHTLAELHTDGLSWYRGENGAHVPIRGVSDGSRIYLHADMLDGPTSRPVHEVAGHEIAHVMENLHPDLYADVVKYADTTKDSVYKQTRLAKGYTEEQLKHEMAADLVSDTLADPTRMRQAMAETPGLFPRLATYIRDFIDHTLRKLGLRKDATASGLVENLRAARADVMKALAQMRARRAAGERAPPEIRYSLDEPPSQADLEAAAAEGDREKMRGHIATIQRMTEVSPDVKARVESYYTPTARDAVERAATDTINKLGLDRANDKFMRAKAGTAENMALGHKVALRYDQLNRYDEAQAVREEMAKRLTNPAQTLWYVSTIGKTSPEGLIDTAQKLVTGMVKPEAQSTLDQINRLRAEISALKDEKAKAAAIQIVVRQMGKVKNPAQRLNPKQLDDLLTRHAQGKLDENQLANTLKKYFKIPQLTPDNINKIKAAQKAWANVPDDQPLLKQIRAADMMDSVYGLVPHTFWEKMRAASVISMIWHGKLPIRIGASSALRLAGDTVVDGIMNFLPDIANVFSGRSTMTGGQVRGIIEGLWDPVRAYRAGYTDARIRGLAMTPSFKEGMHALVTRSNLVNRGIMDVQSMRGGTHTFSSRFGRFMENSLNILHNVVPLAFYDAAYRSSLYRQMRAERVATPTADMVFDAHVDANKVISNNPTVLYHIAKLIRTGLDLPTNPKAIYRMAQTGKLAGTSPYGLGTALLPFALKPASLLTEGAMWTPLGVGKAAFEILRPVFNKGEPIRPREVGSALIKAALGTGMAVGAGYQLGKLGIVTGAPDENKDLDAMRRASGMGAYKINVSELKRRVMSGNWWSVIPFTNTEGQRSDAQDGDYIINYNWLEPVAFPIAAGADLAQSEKNRVISLKKGRITPGAVASAGGAAVGSLTDAPMLQGVQQFAQAIGEKDYMRAAVGLFSNVPGNFVPALVRQTAQYMDNTVRETRGTFSGPITAGRVIDREASSILSQIPGLEGRYPAKYDVFGEAVERYNYGNNSLLNVFFNPAMISRFKENPQLAEMERLYEGTGAGKGEPRVVPATLFINGKQVELTNEQIAAYQHYVGKESSAVITRLLASPKFAAEPMQQKQAVMSQVLSAVNTAAKIDLFGDAPVKVGMGIKGPTLSKPTPMDIGALIQARRSGLNRPDFVQPQPASLKAPLWQLVPQPTYPLPRPQP